MTTFPMASPPSGPGIYLLSNRKLGKAYVGQSLNLHRRYGEWKSVFLSKLGAKNTLLLDIIGKSDISEWEFTILQELPGATSAQLMSAETVAISRIKTLKPTALLNSTASRAADRSSPIVNDGSYRAGLAKSKVIGPHGAMSQAEVAQAKGVTVQTVKKKLRKLRGKGIFEVEIEKL